MENPKNIFGFRPVIRIGGAPFSVTEYAKPASDPQAIFMFDIVGKKAAAVTLLESQGSSLPALASAYDTGAFTVGSSLWQGASLAYGAASTPSVHLVADEADVIYLAQCTGATISSASHVGKNANISLTTAGSMLTKQSGQAVDGATLATSEMLDLKVTRVVQIGQDAEGADAILEVIINKHQNASKSRLRRG